MKINTVRVSEVGCHARPVAIEGLSSGLNILTGANEAGKSTLLKALRLAFEERHTGKKAERLRPYGGGAPLIEVEFTCGGRTWQLRKQYLNGRMAELRDLTSGLLWRGADAEEHLAELVAQSHGAPLALLWAGQKEALAPTAPSIDAQQSLRQAIAAEFETVVDGSDVRQVRRDVRQELELYLTTHRPGRPRGDYDAALRLRDSIGTELRTALDRQRSARQRLDRLAELMTRSADLNDTTRIAALMAKRAAAEDAVRAARESANKRRAAEGALAAAEAKLALSRDKAQALADDLRALQALEADMAGDRDETRVLHSTLADAEARAADAREARDAARAASAAANRELTRLLDAERLLEARRRLDNVLAQLDGAKAAMKQGLTLREDLGACRISEDLLRQLQRAAEAVERLEDRLAAAAPKVSVAYAPGADGRITRDGAPVFDGEALLVERPLVLRIEGVGTITVAAGGSSDLDAVRSDLAARRTALAGLLAACGADDLAAAEAALLERRQIEAALAEARTRFATLAPAGLPALQTEADALAARTSASDDEAAPLHDRVATERTVAEAAAMAAEKEEADEVAQRQLNAAREAAAGQASRAAARLQRLRELEARLPAAGQRDVEHEKLVGAVRAAEAETHAAARDCAAWRERAPDESGLRALDVAAEVATRALRDDEAGRGELARSIAGLEGELRADRHDDVEAKVAELDGKLVSADARVKRLEDEIAALQLLDAELQTVETGSREQYLRPVTARLQPYVQQVFPNARTTISETFVPLELQRATGEAIAALSEGTQEQLAVLVRLAFGRMLADMGQPVPVILDDALVYCDDQRMLSMFAALETAARHHQVIVLTCRARAFQDLAGHRLQVTPWLAPAAATAGGTPLAVAAGR